MQAFEMCAGRKKKTRIGVEFQTRKNMIQWNFIHQTDSRHLPSVAGCPLFRGLSILNIEQKCLLLCGLIIEVVLINKVPFRRGSTVLYLSNWDAPGMSKVQRFGGHISGPLYFLRAIHNYSSVNNQPHWELCIELVKFQLEGL